MRGSGGYYAVERHLLIHFALAIGTDGYGGAGDRIRTGTLSVEPHSNSVLYAGSEDREPGDVAAVQR